MPFRNRFPAKEVNVFNGMKFDTFTLGNELQVLTVSDPRFVKSSAALAVMAGSMQNPDDHLGLAHFLEHMLFLGTEDYPGVGEYEDFLNKNGGGHNAYTSIDHTNYFFDVVDSGFEDSLKRFSRFFVCPTFDEKYVDREKNAVHSEHEKNRQDDGRREYRFLQMITDPKHPFSKFATGDKNTLSQANRDIVMDFYKTKYSSNLMRLVLMSALPSEQLKTLAKNHFSDIPNLQIDKPQFDDQLFVHGDTPLFHEVETVRDKDFLKISFDMPDDLPYWDSKPTQFLAQLLGEEGEGSLLSFLKRKGWAVGLETSTWWRMFHIKVQLTKEGKKQRDPILKAVFSYIELLKKEGLKDYIFNERQILSALDLKNMEPKSSMSRASHFSASMLYYPVDEFLSHHYLYHKHSPDDFSLFLNKLTTKNLQVSYFSKSKCEGQVEPYYGINYSSSELSKELVEALDSVPVYPDFKYPEVNPYIPTNTELVAPPSLGAATDELYKDYSRLFAQQDTELEIPRASISLSFISDAIERDPQNYLLAKLFARMKREELNEWGYPVSSAGLNFNISHGYNTITVDVNGYSQHLSDLLKNLIYDEQNARSIAQVNVSEETFLDLKRKMKKSLQNKDHDAAYQQILYESGNLFSTAAIHYKDYLPFIEKVTLEQVKDFAKKFFQKVAIRSFTYGNIDGAAVKPAIDLFFSKIKASGFTESDVEAFENKFLEMPNKKMAAPMSGSNNNNAQLTFYKVSDWSIRDQAYVDVIGRLIEQPFFTELRTHQQLGYVVAGFPTSSHAFCGLGTLIQSDTHEALDCFQRSDQFLHQVLKDLKTQLKSDDVEAVKASIINDISQSPNSLGERQSRFTMMAGTYHGDFHFLDKLVSEIKKITEKSLKSFIEEAMALDRGTLVFLYNGSQSKSQGIPEGFEKIDSFQEFTAQWPRIQPYKKSKTMV